MTATSPATAPPEASRRSRKATATETAGGLKRAVIYLRVSTQRQVETDVDEDGLSIASQRESCLNRAETAGAVVIDEYIDRGETATKASRPELQRMLARIETGQDVDYVIVFKVDRFARNIHDHVTIAKLLKDNGACLVSVTEPIDDSPPGQLIENVMATIAQFYSANLSKDVTEKMGLKARRGGTIGRAPLGYLNVRDEVEGKKIAGVRVDPERGPLIRWAFESYATGRYSIRQLATELEAKGLLTRRTGKKGGNPVTRSHLQKILSNPYYCGLIVHQGQTLAGRHKPLIERETFDLVQAVLEARRNGERQRTHSHYLKGTIYCARCKGRLGFTRSKGRGGEYDYFYCLAGNRNRSACNLPMVPVEEVEEAIERYYGALAMSPEQSDRMRRVALQAFDYRQRFASQEIERLRALETRLTVEDERLMDALKAGHLSHERYGREQSKIERQLHQARLVARQASIDLGQLTTRLDEVLGYLAEPQDSYRRSGDITRQQHNRAFFERIDVDVDGVVYARLKEPYATLHRDGFVEGLESETKNPDAPDGGRGFIKDLMVEVLALLAKHELRAALEQMVGRTAEDDHVPVVQRPRQHQNRLAVDQIDEVVTRYVDGASIDALAREYGINRTTVIGHLERNGVERRRNPRKMTDDKVRDAASRYSSGCSLATVASEFGVCERTLRREFQRAGVDVRPRRGSGVYVNGQFVLRVGGQESRALVAR